MSQTAAKKSSAVIKLDNLTECCICLKTFTDPRMLPCIHTFCFQCLNDLADKSNKKAAGEEIPCPVCRKEFTIPRDGVHGIQKNFFMAGMTEVRNALNQSNVKSLLCDICKAYNEVHAVKIAEATYRCLVCQENFCDSCCKMHKTFKVSRNHDVIKIGLDVGEENVVKTSPITCDVHRGKVLDFYCAECKKVVCVSCFVESHKAHDCKDVNTVDEELRNIISNRAHIISTLYDEILTKKNSCESKETFLRKIAATEKEILQRSEALMKIIQEQTTTLLGSLHEIKNQHLKEIRIKEDELDRRLLVLESFSRYCNELTLMGSASDICRSKEEILRRADELEEDHETYFMLPNTSVHVIFQATDFGSMVKTKNGNMIGSVTESVEQLEKFAVAFGGDATFHVANDYWHSYKIQLHGRSELASQFQSLPIKVYSYGTAAVYNNEMFMTGVGAQSDEIWRYSFASGWKKRGSLLQGRQFHCAEFMDETLYICGGSIKFIVLDSIEAYSMLTEKTTIVGQLKFGSYRPASVVYKGSIYVFGGLDKDWKTLDCVQAFSPVGNTCTLLSTSMPRSASMVRAVLWKTYAILLVYGDCIVFNFEEKTWQERQEFKLTAGVRFFGMVLENERIFIIGGTYNEADVHGYIRTNFIDEVKYIRASSVVNNEAAKWKTYGKLPKPIGVITSVKLSMAK